MCRGGALDGVHRVLDRDREISLMSESSTTAPAPAARSHHSSGDPVCSQQGVLRRTGAMSFTRGVKEASEALKTFFVVGLPRSGSTLLAYLLAGIPESLSLSEPYLAQDIYPHWRLRRFFRQVERSANLERVRLPRPCVANTLLEHMRRLALLNGMRYLFVKETYRFAREWKNAHLLDQLALRDHTLIALHRHPYDVAASSVKFCRWWRGVSGRMIRLVAPRIPLFPNDRSVVEHCADNWVEFHRWCRRHRAYMVRYEDLVREPGPTLRRLCESTGLPYCDSMLDHKCPRSAFGGIGAPEVLRRPPRAVDTRSVGRKDLLRHEWQEIISSRCAPHSAALDYEF